MILVILGTQDKDFSRLLKAVEREIDNGVIKDRVVVQAGQTKYKSDKMEIFDLLPAPEFDKLMDEADLVITHGGVGSILAAIKKGKKVIAAARLSKYKEHHNDHQKQIISEFVNLGYVLELRDFNKLGKVIEKSKKFKQKKFESNTNNMIELIRGYIEDTNHISWYNKCHNGFFFGIVAFIINTILFLVFRNFISNNYVSNVMAWFVSILVLFFISSIYKNNKKEIINFFVFSLGYCIFDLFLFYLFYKIFGFGVVLVKVISNTIMVFVNIIVHVLISS